MLLVPVRSPMPRLAPAFFQQTHTFDAHSPVHRLAHIVYGQQPHAYRRQRFHFDAGPPDGLRRSCAFDRVVVLMDQKLDTHLCQRKRMTQRDQVRGALRSLYCCQAGDTKDVALLRAAI